MMQQVSSHDLTSLRELWTHLNQRVFSRLDQSSQAAAAARLEAGVLKLYVVNCLQTRRPEKAREFFERLSSDLQGQPEWREWFALPFLPSPESNPTFSPYFTRQWQEALMLSLHNFLSIAFACLPPPRIAEHSSAVRKIRRLREENDALRRRLNSLHAAFKRSGGASINDIACPEALPPEDIMDDFYIIAQEAPTSESQAKTLKSFLRNITGSSSSSSTSPSQQQQQQQHLAGGDSSGDKSKQPSNKQISSSLKETKSRSSSKSRPSAPVGAVSPSSSQQQQQHAPVKRVSQSSLGPPPSSLGLASGGGGAASVSPSLASSSSKENRLAYLLLGQEEYLEHHSEVTHARFSTSGYLIASSDVDGVVKVWSASPAPLTQATFISPSSVTALEWLPDSERHFLYGTSTGSIRLCDKEERRAINEAVISGGRKVPISTLACAPSGANGGVFVAGTGSALRLYDSKMMSLVHEFGSAEEETGLVSASPHQLTCCAFNHNSQMVLTSGSDGKTRIFDLRRKDCISSWSVSTSTSTPVLGIALSADETSVYALTSSGSFSAWSVYQSGQRIFEHLVEDPFFSDGDGAAPCRWRTAWGRPFALAGDGRHLLVCSASGGIVYELRGGGAGIGAGGVGGVDSSSPSSLEKVLGLKGHRRHTTCTDWSAANDDCGPCVTAGSEGHIRVSTLLSQ